MYTKIQQFSPHNRCLHWYLQCVPLKGQSHKKSWRDKAMGVSALTKSRYFLNFSDRPFNSYDFLKFIFCLSFRLNLLLTGFQFDIHELYVYGKLIAGILVS
jgi:hypothetical protein